MLFFAFLAAFLLIQRIRKALPVPLLAAKWGKLLNAAIWIIIVAFVAATLTLPDTANMFIGAFTLLGVVWFANKEPDFEAFRPLVRSYIPLILVAFLCAIIRVSAPGFYKKWDDYFEFAILGSFLWIVARLVNTQKQQKELKISEERRAELETLVAERTAELTVQKNELQETIKELRSAQDQLIQQEKLASLGELTAGIAHEIQNPLNFVNNFSEVSTELLAELKEGPIERLPDEEKEYAYEIIQDLTQNLGKIAHHGKRADSIVKGMLQHSRKGTGQKEPVNINSLADEYLRLSYHGFRAKDKTFNAGFKTEFEHPDEIISAIPQDIGRVLLNLFNNAFYSVSEKKKKLNDRFDPFVKVSTRRIQNKVEISVYDNGLGVPKHVTDKIFQPFFTTKPTGQGTGLGLSLSYDIVTKGHGGDLEITTTEGEFAEFIIRLPVE